MADTWQKIEGILEARSRGPLNDLLDYVRDRHGEHEADELLAFVQGHGLQDIRKHVTLKYMDGRADRLAAGLGAMAGGGSPSSSRSSDAPAGDRPGGRTADKGSGPSEPIPARPQRFPSAGSELDRPTPSSAGSHAVGTAGRHVKQQNPDALAAEPPETTVVKPSFKGSFVGQQWQPNAYSAPEPTRKDKETGEKVPGEIDSIESAIEKELAKPQPDIDHVRHLKAKLGILQRRQGGLKMRPIQHGNQATGNMSRGGLVQNPAKPGSAVLRRGKETVPWEREHPGWVWTGDDWVPKSKWVAMKGERGNKPER